MEHFDPLNNIDEGQALRRCDNHLYVLSLDQYVVSLDTKYTI